MTPIIEDFLAIKVRLAEIERQREIERKVQVVAAASAEEEVLRQYLCLVPT